MALDASKFRSFVEDLLRSDRSRTEREVKAAAVKMLKVSPREVGASVIRDVRKKMGIDRPSALSHARALLAKDPAIEARKVIDSIREKFGIRLGPPDVSRLRPSSAKSRAGRPGRPARRGRKPAAAKAAGKLATSVVAKPATAPARRKRAGRRGRKPGRVAVAAAPSMTAASAAPAVAAKRRRGRPARVAAPAAASANTASPKSGEISMNFEGKGSPADLAAFFLSLSRQR